jgi:hypothetical protein
VLSSIHIVTVCNVTKAAAAAAAAATESASCLQLAAQLQQQVMWYEGVHYRYFTPQHNAPLPLLSLPLQQHSKAVSAVSPNCYYCCCCCCKCCSPLPE